MIATTDSPTQYKLCSVFHFLWTEGNSAAEIHGRMSHVHSQDFMSNGVVNEWSTQFKDGQTDIHDEGGQGQTDHNSGGKGAQSCCMKVLILLWCELLTALSEVEKKLLLNQQKQKFKFISM